MQAGLATVVIASAFTALSGIILALRCISRFMVVHKAGTDDIFVILAYLSSIATTFLDYQQYSHGLGHSIYQLPPVETMHMLRYLHASIITYALAMTFVKLSAVCQFQRFLFDPKFKIICWILLGLFSAFGSIAVIVTIFQCQPVTFSWDHSIPGGKCINLLAWYYTASGWSILTDFVVAAIPIFAIKDINMPVAQKRALIIVFALGGFGCIASILRVGSLHKAVAMDDITKDSTDAAWWSSVEMNIGIICVSLPPLKALVVVWFPSIMADNSTYHTAQSQIELSFVTRGTEHTVRNSMGFPPTSKELDPHKIP